MKLYRSDLCKLKWYCKVKHVNHESLPFKLLSNEWDKVKSKGLHQKCQLARVNFLKNKFSVHDKILEIQLIEEALDKSGVRKLRWPYNINSNCVFTRN